VHFAVVPTVALCKFHRPSLAETYQDVGVLASVVELQSVIAAAPAFVYYSAIKDRQIHLNVGDLRGID